MQNPETTFRIEMFGNLVDELKYWHNCLSDENSDDSIDYCEDKFEETLTACREYREILIEELDEYVKDCRNGDIPIDLSYWRIRKQLQETDFE